MSVLREAPKVRCHIALRYVFWGLGGRFPPTSEAGVQRLLDSRFCKSLYKHLPCLPVVSGIHDTKGYQEFRVIRSVK